MRFRIRDQPLAGVGLRMVLLLLVGIVLASSALPVSAQTDMPMDQWIQGQTTVSMRANRYTFYGSAGQYVTIRMERDDAWPRLDPWLDLREPSGYVVISDDDSAGGGNSLIDGYYLQSTGWYTVVARSYNNQSYGRYWLYATVYW